MSKPVMNRIRIFIVSVCSLFIIGLLSACQGVVTSSGSYNGTSANGNAVTGQLQAVNAQAHSVTLSVNGQQITISGLTDQQIAALQSQLNQTYTFQVTPSGNNTYTINQNTQPQQENTSTTASTTNQNGTPAQGDIEFAGKVQSVNGTSAVIATPDGQSLTIAIVTGVTDTSDMNGTALSAGQIVKVKASTDQNGNLVASKLGIDKPEDQQQDMSTVQYQGITTSSVGANNQISFKVGHQSYTFPIANGADLKDFNNSAQAIGNNMPVQVKVLFTGTRGTAVKISNPNN
jgi:predicted small secreted protein